MGLGYMHRSTDPRSFQAYAPDADVRVLEHCAHCPDLEDPAAFTQALG